MDDLTGTGERLDPGARPRTHDEHAHLARYLWAAGRVRGDVLDVACGTGYGTKILLDAAAVTRVTAVDNYQPAVERTRAQAPAAEVVCAEVPPLPFGDGRFDAVVSMETIEHIDDDRAFTSEVRRVLRDGGRFLLSTPNADVTSQDGVVVNPWHAREYRREVLVQLVQNGGFEHWTLYAQQVRRQGRTNELARRILARFPGLCRAEAWWDAVGHGNRSIVPWDGEGVPVFWLLECW